MILLICETEQIWNLDIVLGLHLASFAPDANDAEGVMSAIEDVVHRSGTGSIRTTQWYAPRPCRCRPHEDCLPYSFRQCELCDIDSRRDHELSVFEAAILQCMHQELPTHHHALQETSDWEHSALRDERGRRKCDDERKVFAVKMRTSEEPHSHIILK